jgi:hypothetical protein
MIDLGNGAKTDAQLTYPAVGKGPFTQKHNGHDNIDFRPIITKTSQTRPLSVVTVDKGYDSEENMFWLENYYMDSV